MGGDDNNEHVAAEVISASIGGMFSSSALYPLEVLKTKMQAGGQNDDEEGNPPTTTLTLARTMYQEEGLAAFYHGVGTSAVQSATEKALYFFAYSSLKNLYTTLTASSELGTVANLTLGCAAEWAHLPVTLPIDCLTTKIQTSDETTNGQGAFTLLSAMLSEQGLAGMYKGIQAYTVLCLKPSIQYTLFEQLKKIHLARRAVNQSSNHHRRSVVQQQLSALEAFVLGMFARTVATMVVFPYLRAKVMLQSSNNDDDNNGNDGKKAPTSIPQMLMAMYREGGLRTLFQGLGPELTRGVLSAALMLMVKEKISGGVSKLLRG